MVRETRALPCLCWCLVSCGDWLCANWLCPKCHLGLHQASANLTCAGISIPSTGTGMSSLILSWRVVWTVQEVMRKIFFALVLGIAFLQHGLVRAQRASPSEATAAVS